MSLKNQQHYFTFGAEHVLPNGKSAKDKFVMVSARFNHREVFMGWLGSNAFSTEYDQSEWEGRKMAKYYDSHALAAYIKVTENP